MVFSDNSPWSKLYDWQKEATAKFFDFDKKMVAVVPTGAGKTFFAIYVLKVLQEEDPNMRVLIIVPKIVIINTWIEELFNNEFFYHDVGIYKGGCKEFSRITITTIASASKLDMSMFDFCIFDELHNFGSPSMKKIISTDFKYKLGLTATPDRTDDKHWEIFKNFNYNIYEYDIEDAVKEEVLNKYDFYDVVLKLDKSEFKEYEVISMQIASHMKTIGGYYTFMRLPAGDPKKIALMKLFDIRKKLIWHNKKKLEIVSNICKHYNDGSKIIVFSQYNSTTNSLYYHLGSNGIKAAVVHSNIPEQEKIDGLKKFDQGEINILLTTKVLDEGYNLPKIDIGIILAGERSQRQTIQRLGRVLRKKNKKSKLFQVYFTNTFEEITARHKSRFFKKFCENYKKIVA